MDRELFEILDNVHSETGGKHYPLFSLYGPNKEWKVRENKVSEFWKGYCRLVDNDFDRDYPLAEVPTKNMPIVLDFLFRFPRETMCDEPFRNDLVYLLVQTCQNSIEHLFDIVSDDRKEFICCYLESENMWEEVGANTVYDCVKIRLQFPFCHVNASIQETKLCPMIAKALEDYNAVDLFPSPPVGTWDEIIDKTVSTKPLTMYGSSEAPGRPKLILNCAYTRITEEHFDVAGIDPYIGEIEELDLDGLFDFQNHIHNQNRLINRNIFVENNDVDYWLPLYLSIGYWSSMCVSLKECHTKKTRSKGKERVSPSRRTYPRKSSPMSTGEELEGDHYEVALELLPLLKPHRFTARSYWEDIAHALYHATEGQSVGLKTLLKYTREHCPDRERECEDYYRTCSKSRVSVKTIAWYAREDNPRDYKEWHKMWCLKSMEEALSCLDNDIAKCFYKFYWLDYLCTCNGAAFRWWQFKNHRWHDIHKGIRLKRRISNDFAKNFEKMRISLCRQVMESNDETFRTQGNLNVKKIGTLLRRLKSTAPKGKIMVESIEFFLHDDFEKWIDDNDDITGVENGILEICGRECIFRSGKPEDYNTKTAIVPYDRGLYMEHPLVQECLEWIHQVFPDKDLARHFLKYCASFLKSGNREKFLVVFSGAGDNSKSMICKLFGLFGGYCVRLPVTCVTQGRQRSSGPNPEMARAKAAKIAIMQEPEDEDVLKGGIVKDVTGGEPFFARFLNDNGGEIKNTFKLILMCNEIPTFTNPGKALKNRFRIFPFLSTWVDDAPTDPEERYATRTFQKDPFFEDRIKFMMPAFLWLLKEYYPIYATEGLIDPPIIKDHTDQYWRENNIYEQYVTDRICQAKDAKGNINNKVGLTLTKVFNDFKMFMQENYPSANMPDRKHVKTNISLALKCKLKGRAWYGIRFQQSEVDMSHFNQPGEGPSFTPPDGEGLLGL